MDLSGIKVLSSGISISLSLLDRVSKLLLGFSSSSGFSVSSSLFLGSGFSGSLSLSVFESLGGSLSSQSLLFSSLLFSGSLGSESLSSLFSLTLKVGGSLSLGINLLPLLLHWLNLGIPTLLRGNVNDLVVLDPSGVSFNMKLVVELVPSSPVL